MHSCILNAFLKFLEGEGKKVSIVQNFLDLSTMCGDIVFGRTKKVGQKKDYGAKCFHVRKKAINIIVNYCTFS